jgi:hypothetical protein
MATLYHAANMYPTLSWQWSLGPIQPAPNSASSVGTSLSSFNTQTFSRDPVAPDEVRDFEPYERITWDTIEAGYKVLLGDRLYVEADVFYRRTGTNWAGRVTTPNVFFDEESLARYLTDQGLASGVADSLAGRVAAIPVGTVNPQQLEGSDVYSIPYQLEGWYQNWGADASVQYRVTSRWRLSGTYSWLGDRKALSGITGSFEEEHFGTPRNAGSLSLEYVNRERGLDGALRGRAVESYRVQLAAWPEERIAGYAVLDAEVGYRLFKMPESRLSFSMTNVFDKRHQEYGGSPEIGRLVLVQLQTWF